MFINLFKERMNYNMKRITSIVLLIATLTTLFAVPTAGFAKQQRFIVAESYNDYVTGDSPLGGAVAGGKTRVVVTNPGKEKAVELSASSGDNTLYYAASLTDDVALTMRADLEYKKSWSYTEFYITNSANKSFVVGYVNEKGEFHSGDARIASNVPKDRQFTLHITYNTLRQKVSIYLDGKALAENRYLGSSAFEEIAGFGIKVKAKNEYSLLADNFAIYEGYGLTESSEIPKKPFNPEEVISNNTVSSDGSGTPGDVFVGDTVFTNRTFDEEGDAPEFDGITVSQGDNKIYMDKSVFTGNKYIKLEKKGTAESYIAYAGNSAARYIVVQSDFSTDSNPGAGKLMYTRDGNAASMFNTFLTVAANGNINTTDGRVVAKIEPLKWVNIAIAIDVANLKFDVYVDRELKYKDVVFQNKTITGIPLLRTSCNKGSGSGNLLIDNVRTYEGTKPRELEDAIRKSKVTPDSVAQSYLGSYIAIHPFADRMYVNKTKQKSTHKMLLNEDETIVYLHEDDLKVLFGKSNLTLSGAHPTEANYYDADAVAKSNGFLNSNMDTRLHFYNKGPIDLTQAQMEEIQRYLFNERNDMASYLKLFSENGANKHPRLLMNAAELENIKKLYTTDPLMKEWGDNTIAHANTFFGMAPYKYYISGSSMEDVDKSDTAIMSLCMAYFLTGNERYAARCWKFLENICNLKNWNPYGYLDVGELGFFVGLGYDWLYDYLTPEQRKFLEENIYEKCVNLTKSLYYNELEGKTFVNNHGRVDEYYTGWWDSENNWQAVCNGGVTCAAIAIMDVYPDVCADVINNTVRALEYILPTYYPEGAWGEGSGYWTYALSYMVRTITTLRNAFGTDFGFTKSPGFDNTGWYGTYLAGSTGMYAIGDAGGGFANNVHIMWLAKDNKDKLLMAARMNEYEKFGHKGGVQDMLYYDPTLLDGEIEMPLDTYMKGMEVIALREAWYDTGTTFVGSSGGSTNRGHGHHDTGSFQINMAGERFIKDTGAENYNASGYFSTNRYRFYRSRAEGHNMYIINPELDNPDYYGIVSGTVTAELVQTKPRGAYGIMNMDQIYSKWATSAKRGIMLSDDRRSVTVRDEIDLIQPNSEVYWSLHTTAKIENIADNQIVLTLNGKKMLITVETNGKDLSFAEADAVTISNVIPSMVKDTNNMSVGLKKILLKVTGSGRLNITAKFKQYDDMMIADAPTNEDIANWEIPDGEVTPLPMLDMIYIDGEPVEGFDPKITGYSKLLASKTEVAPTVTVDTSLKYEIIPTPTAEGDTLVKVFAPGRDDVYRTYRINFWKKPPLQDIDGMRRYPIAKATASEVPEEQNTPDKVFDMDFSTRWAAQSINIPEQWIMLELDDVYPIEKIGVSWMSGTARQYTYILEISEDGVNWTEVFNGKSSGTTAKCEYTQVYGKKAKFVRYKGYGNTINEWNSITEIEVLGNQR